MSLQTTIENLEAWLPEIDQIDKSVSEGDVNWHIDHSLQVIIGICATLLKSDPSKYKWEFNAARLLFFTVGEFPRGKGDAPKVVQPKERASVEKLRQLLEKAKQSVKQVADCPKNSYFKHFAFGLLNREHAFRFIHIHTEHHIRIIKDIVKKVESTE